MEISKSLLGQIESDLGLNIPFIKGLNIEVNKCWHFYSNGNNIDEMFYTEDDFRHGMNRIYVAVMRYKVIILAFVLMDTHFHFILYGEHEECYRFVQDYVKRTSRYIAWIHNDNNKLKDINVRHQKIDTDIYLKTVICYVLRNPSVGGINALPHNYPWSSGALYFAGDNVSWATSNWVRIIGNCQKISDLSEREARNLLHTKRCFSYTARVIEGLIFPGDYVAYEIVERLFKSYRSFQFYLGQRKEMEVESREGAISSLSIPMQEMRQHRSEVCLELFGNSDIHRLKTQERLKLAKVLRQRYNSSTKQIIRLCGLKYDECKDMI